MSSVQLIDGQPAAMLSCNDRGLAYGQGLFETVQVRAGRRLFWSAHLARLLQGCRCLAIPSDGLSAALDADWAALDCCGDGVLKITVTRGTGGRGYAVTTAIKPTRIVQFSAGLPAAEAEGVVLRWCTTALAQQPLLAGIKHLNRLEQVLARAEWQDPAIREGLVCDTSGWVIEGTMSNLFFVSGGRLCTPELSLCGVSGIIRNWVLQAAPGAGITVEVGRYRPAQVEQAEELFICNSLLDIVPVCQLDKQRFNIGPITRLLQQRLQQEYLQC